MGNSDDARGFAVFACGPTDCGKSQLLWQLYTRRAPRKLTIEVVPETHKRDPAAFCTFGFEELQAKLAECTRRKTWHVIAALNREEVERLFCILAPPFHRRGSVSFARAVGGLVLFCGELAFFAGRPLTKDSPVKDAYLRGRHHWLSIHGATQHASDCDPCTRMQAARCVFFQTVDKLGLQAVENASSPAVAERVAQLAQYHSVTWVRSLARGYVLDARYELTEMIDYSGATLWRRASAGALAGVASSARENGTVPHSTSRRQLPSVS